MENQEPKSISASGEAAPKNAEWSSTKVYVLGGICLLLGIAVGALFHGPAKPSVAPVPGQTMNSAPAMPAQGMPGMGMDPSAVLNDPIFEKVKSDPNNFELLAQAGIVAMKGGNPKVAIDYYQRALKVKEDPEVRTNLGNAYFRSGEADEALAQFATVLKSNPKDPNALYNSGVVRLMGKNDPKGAAAAWEMFLKYNPDHPRRAKVEEMLQRVKGMAAAK